MTAGRGLFAVVGSPGDGAAVRRGAPLDRRVPCRGARFFGAMQKGAARMNEFHLRVAARTLAGLVALWAVACTAAGPTTFRVEPALTSTEFAVTQLGIAKQRGRFERTWGAIVLDPARSGGSVDFIIDTASVRTGWNVRDEFLRGEDMFDARRYPTIRFHSTRLGWDAARLIAIDGNVELHGVTQPVRLEVRKLACATGAADGREGCGAAVATRISRAAFGMTYAYPVVGDEIELDIAITAYRVRDGGETEPP